MTPRSLAAGIALLAVVGLTAPPIAGQTQTAKKAPVPRAPDGKPSLQGVWDFRTLTPLERPANLGDKAFLSEDEAARIQKQNADRRAKELEPSDPNAPKRAPGGGGLAVGGYNDYWLDFGEKVVGNRRTSLIIDPPNGRLPDLKPGVQRQVGSLWEDLSLERPI